MNKNSNDGIYDLHTKTLGWNYLIPIMVGILLTASILTSIITGVSHSSNVEEQGIVDAHTHSKPECWTRIVQSRKQDKNSKKIFLIHKTITQCSDRNLIYWLNVKGLQGINRVEINPRDYSKCPVEALFPQCLLDGRI